MKATSSVALALVLLAGGCASNSWQAENIPYPRTTPFDSNEFARRAFLDGFRSRYRAQRNEAASQVETLSGPYVRARQLGFYAGVAEARSELESGSSAVDGSK